MSLPWLEGVICLFRRDGKTWFIDYRDYPHKIHEGKYSPPGGKVDTEKYERPIDAAVREAREEACILAEAKDLIYRGTVHFYNEQRTVKGKPMTINMTVSIYECYKFDDSHARASEIKDGRAARLEQIPDDKISGIKELHEGDRKMFQWLGLYKEFEGTITQKDESLERAELASFVGFSKS